MIKKIQIRQLLISAQYRLNNFINQLFIKKWKIELKNNDFSIIGNNCWAGGIYEDFKIEYKTPTVGLFFYAPDYIKFVSNLERNLGLPLHFIDNSRYEIANQLRDENRYPIGLIDNEIEIHFLHYKNNQDAEEKWERRKKRINKNNIFLAFSDKDLCTEKLVIDFDRLPYPKVIFSSKKNNTIKSLIYLPKFKNHNEIGDIYSDRLAYRIHFNVSKWLNNGYKK